MKQNTPSYGGFSLYFLWLVLLMSFTFATSAIYGFKGALEQGIPLWLQTIRVLILVSFTICSFFILGGRKVAYWGFFLTAAIMIPFSVAYSYYFSLATPGFNLTFGWIVTNTVVTAVVMLVVVTFVLLAIRPHWNTFR